MRSALLVLATLVLAVCGFVIYSQMQGPIAARSSGEQRGAKGPASIPAGSRSATQPVGAGEEAWVRRYDEKTAELESQFRAARYEPQPDGTVRVEKPVAEFFLGGGRFVRIEGTRGSVVMPNTQVVEGGEVRPPPSAPPSRGQLHDVVISMFDEPAAEGEATPEPTLTVAMNNTSFDNDTFLITTEAFTDASNNRVEADQVPVKVRGRDYDFDGRGLRIQWNELNERLQLLEIAHGESLTVKNRAKFQEMQSGKSPTAGAASPPSGADDGPARPKRPKSQKPAAAATATAPATKPAVPYRASFEKDLRITEGEQEIASGSLMQVDFMLEKGDRTDSAAGAAAGAQTAAISAGGRTVSRSRANVAPTTAPAESATAPATKPAAELLPIVVRWTGRLRVMPLELSDGPPLAADAQIIRLAGTPLKMYRDGANIEAAGATFHTADGSASLRSSDEVPRVTLRNADGAVISTPGLAYAEDGGVATLKGPGQADIPMGEGNAKTNLSATWGDECLLALPKDANGEATIRHANLTGSVAIAHPRMDLNSDALELSFAAPATQPAVNGEVQPTTRKSDAPDLERLLASGSVIAKLRDPNGATSSMQARTLEMQTLATPDGELLPRTIIADGDVLMSDSKQSLRAQRVNATLKPKPKSTTAPASDDERDADAVDKPTTAPTTSPTTQPVKEPFEMTLESLIAQGAVRLEGEGGAYATAEQLEAYDRDGVSEVKLMGVGPSSAVVSDGKSTITGPVLTLRPQDQRAEVPGGGTMVLVRETEAGKPAPEPVHVAWTGHASLDGKTNLVDLHEGVAFKTVDAEGMTTTSKASHLQIALVDKPTTQPATQPTADSATQPATQPATEPATRPAEGLAALQDMDFLANKDPRSAKLTGGVEVESTLLNAEGGILRRMYINSEEASYDMEARRMVVPLPGRLLYEDHRPPEAKKEGDEDEGPANRGTTAFEWKRQLTYDDNDDRAVMEGDVEINHVPDDPNGQSFRISTQRVSAEMEPKPTTVPATLPATNPATQPSAPAARMRLKQVIADGGVSVRTNRFQFAATRVTYSPTTGILTAHGAPGEPITLTDEQGQVDSAIESLTWNTKTDQVSLKGGRGRVRP